MLQLTDQRGRRQLQIDQPTHSTAGTLGRVTSVRGSQATIGLSAPSTHAFGKARATVGKFLGIRTGTSLLIGVVTDVSAEGPSIAGDAGHCATAHVDLVGEIKDNDQASAGFHRGVTEYPAIGDPVWLIGTRELQLVFNISGPSVLDIGHLQQDSSIGAYIDAEDMISKH